MHLFYRSNKQVLEYDRFWICIKSTESDSIRIRTLSHP